MVKMLPSTIKHTKQFRIIIILVRFHYRGYGVWRFSDDNKINAMKKFIKAEKQIYYI